MHPNQQTLHLQIQQTHQTHILTSRQSIRLKHPNHLIQSLTIKSKDMVNLNHFQSYR